MALVSCKECGNSISDKAFACPQCGAPTGRGMPPAMMGYRGVRWRSRAELFGLPLVHVALGGDPATGAMRGVARGIIAVGDIAFGGLAIGGAAFGGVTFGGFSLGIASIGGAAIGILLGLGGFATGYVALGGMAIGYYAMGGLALGAHALGANFQDPEAIEFFRQYLGSMVDEIRNQPGRY
jgi:hypothetical protein